MWIQFITSGQTVQQVTVYFEMGPFSLTRDSIRNGHLKSSNTNRLISRDPLWTNIFILRAGSLERHPRCSSYINLELTSEPFMRPFLLSCPTHAVSYSVNESFWEGRPSIELPLATACPKYKLQLWLLISLIVLIRSFHKLDYHVHFKWKIQWQNFHNFNTNIHSIITCPSSENWSWSFRG